jgi:thioesterase domain-containing protein
MAQQLQRQGQKVGVLALLDTSAPSAQLREQALEEEVDLGDAGVVKDLVHSFKLTTPDDFDQREVDEQLIYAVEQMKKMHHIPASTNIDLVRRYSRMSALIKHIVHVYVAQAYPQHIDHFASSERGPSLDASLEQTASLDEEEDRGDRRVQRWRELATGGMEVHLVPGTHQTLVEEPHVQGLAKALQQCIDRVCKQMGEASM